MTEKVSAEPVVISVETPPTKEKIVKRKTIVYKARVDPDLIEVACEKLKKQLFAKFAFYWFQPKIEEIQFVSLEKYYEPYIVISGRYFINYIRKSSYTIEVSEGVKEVILRPNKHVPENSKSKRIVKLQGEERLVNKAKAFLILDRNGQGSAADNIHLASAEKKPEKAIKEFGIEELAQNADINFIRERIAKRPKDMCKIVEEVFEITERTVIYCPRYKLLFRWMKTGEEKILVLDAVTAERVK
ncbi:hypothetical protein E2P60_04655 [Candidatus Bathyarchaeota archaeon]|nr:hypothetical protein E2P60_04655 [Candidatus Bathyarchaeota archaeon]